MNKEAKIWKIGAVKRCSGIGPDAGTIGTSALTTSEVSIYGTVREHIAKARKTTKRIGTVT